MPTISGTSGVPGVEGIDTRALTKHIREGRRHEGGSFHSGSGSGLPGREGEEFASDVRPGPGDGGDMQGAVPVARWEAGPIWSAAWMDFSGREPGKWRVVAMDYGVKYNILRSLEQRGCTILLLPANTDSATIIDRLEPSRPFPEQRTRRSGSGHLCGGDDPGADGREAHFRNLPGASVGRISPGREDVQAQVRPPGRKPAGERSGYREGGDHFTESRLLRGHGVAQQPGY